MTWEIVHILSDIAVLVLAVIGFRCLWTCKRGDKKERKA